MKVLLHMQEQALIKINVLSYPQTGREEIVCAWSGCIKIFFKLNIAMKKTHIQQCVR